MSIVTEQAAPTSIPATLHTTHPATLAARATLDVMSQHNVKVGHHVRGGGVQTSRGPMVVQTATDLLLSWANETLPNPASAPAVYAIASVVERILKERTDRTEKAKAEAAKPGFKPMAALAKGRKK